MYIVYHAENRHTPGYAHHREFKTLERAKHSAAALHGLEPDRTIWIMYRHLNGSLEKVATIYDRR